MSTRQSKKESYNLKTLNFPNKNQNITKKVNLFKNIKPDYFYLASHGYIDLVKNKIPLMKTPSNISIVFIAPVGLSVSEKLNNMSQKFYKSKNKLHNFHQNHVKFLKDKTISRGLRKCIIIPPESFYLDHTIDIKPSKNLKLWERKEFGLFKLHSKIKKNMLMRSNRNVEKKLSEIISCVHEGIIFVDTCRVLWTEIKGMRNENRICRISGKVHCKRSSEIYNSNLLSNKEKEENNGRAISLYSHVPNDIRAKLSLDKLQLYKKYEENVSNKFKKALIHSNSSVNKSLFNYNNFVSTINELKNNLKLNYTKHRYENEYRNMMRSTAHRLLKGKLQILKVPKSNVLINQSNRKKLPRNLNHLKTISETNVFSPKKSAVRKMLNVFSPKKSAVRKMLNEFSRKSSIINSLTPKKPAVRKIFNKLTPRKLNYPDI